jgi:hypothetical protein
VTVAARELFVSENETGGLFAQTARASVIISRAAERGLCLYRSRFLHHDRDADDREDAAADHVDYMLGLASAAVDGVCHLSTGSGGCSDEGVFAVKALDEEKDAECNQYDANDVFHVEGVGY